MKKIFILLVIVILYSQFIFAQKTVWPMNGKIRVYFNRPVNTSVSSGTNAVYLNSCIADTLVNYINRAKYTLDFAVYNTSSSTAVNKVITAVNNAKTRGVTVRWIYDGSSTNSALSSLNSGINKLGSPTTSSYGIMHCKFMIIDANSSTTTDPIVWTGSTNFSTQQFNTDVNNVVIIQDKPLAQAYTAEFNEMWGSITATPNATNSKFGPLKTDPLSTHTFTIGGKTVELYFSPTDGANAHIESAIASAGTDLYFGVYTFTENVDANAIVTKHNAGVYSAGIIDQYSEYQGNSSACTSCPYSILTSGLGSSLFKVYTQSNSIYHSKYVIVDPSNTSSDPLVETGSHNWTSSADTKNDENILIIHDATVANMYYQSFFKNFTDLGGTLNVITGVEPDDKPSSLFIYPNPCSGYLTIKASGSDIFNNLEIQLFDLYGREVLTQIIQSQDYFKINTENLKEGIYFLKIATPSSVQTRKLEVIR